MIKIPQIEVKIVFKSFKYILTTFQTVSKYSWIGKGCFSALIYINDMTFYVLRTNVVTSPSLHTHSNRAGKSVDDCARNLNNWLDQWRSDEFGTGSLV